MIVGEKESFLYGRALTEGRPAFLLRHACESELLFQRDFESHQLNINISDLFGKGKGQTADCQQEARRWTDNIDEGIPFEFYEHRIPPNNSNS